MLVSDTMSGKRSPESSADAGVEDEFDEPRVQMTSRQRSTVDIARIASLTSVRKEPELVGHKSLWKRWSDHLDWNEALSLNTNKPQGRNWINVIEIVIAAWCAGYYQGYCHQTYGIFPGTMTGNSWSALRETQDVPIDYESIVFKMSAIVCWFLGNFTGMEIMRHMTPGRAVLLKWFDIWTVLFVGCLERWAFNDENEFSNPIKNMMMIISFGSGMSTVYFRLIYGIVTNRLTGNVYRLARGAQDLVHGTSDCPNAALTLGICIFFLYGLYCYYAPWAEHFGLLLPCVVTAGWELIETFIECFMDDGLIYEEPSDDEGNEVIEQEIHKLQEVIDENKEKIKLLKQIANGDPGAQAKLAAIEDNKIQD